MHKVVEEREVGELAEVLSHPRDRKSRKAGGTGMLRLLVE